MFKSTPDRLKPAAPTGRLGRFNPLRFGRRRHVAERLVQNLPDPTAKPTARPARRTLSGRRLDPDAPPALTWHELVPPGPPPMGAAGQTDPTHPSYPYRATPQPVSITPAARVRSDTSGVRRRDRRAAARAAR